MNQFDPNIYQRAWMFATRQHVGQLYEDAEQHKQIPYIYHLASVAMEVTSALTQTEKQFDADFAIQCALLHDVIEDTPSTFEDVHEMFGSAVAYGVLALTKNESLATKRKQLVDSVQRIKQQPHEVWMVKMADRICNLCYPKPSWSSDAIVHYYEEAKLIHYELQDGNDILAERLELKIKNYRQFF